MELKWPFLFLIVVTFSMVIGGISNNMRKASISNERVSIVKQCLETGKYKLSECDELK